MQSQEQQSRDEQSLGQLVASASRDLSTLVRDEIALAKAELKQSAVAAGKGAGMFAAAGFLGYVAFLLLPVAAALGLVALGLAPWLSFLVVAAFFLLVAGLLVFIGVRQLKRVGPPQRTISSIEETRNRLMRSED